jgi:hypothetical protein
MFTVNSMHTFLSDSIFPLPFALNVEKVSHLEQLWKNYAPSKVIVSFGNFSLGRLPTKENLFKRGIFSVTQNLDCHGAHRSSNQRAIYLEFVPLLVRFGTKFSSGLGLLEPFFGGSSGSFCIDENVLLDGGARERFKGVTIGVARNVVAYLES